MDSLLYIVASSLIACIQALPLGLVARLGRIGGLMAYHLDARHRRVARKNITRHFPDHSSDQVRALVKENFSRIGESYASGIKTASMSAEELRPHLELSVPEQWLKPAGDKPLRSVVVAIGHFGNFELYVHLAQFCPGYQGASTYRALPQPSLDRLLRNLRDRSGCLFFERRFEGARLRAWMNNPGMMLGLLCDQDGGEGGLQLPFLGQNCSTSRAAALYALRYDCLLYSAVCHRLQPGRWRIECGPEIATHKNCSARSPKDIMRDVNLALEDGVRKDPANWFWVHNRWKRGRPDPPPERKAA